MGPSRPAVARPSNRRDSAKARALGQNGVPLPQPTMWRWCVEEEHGESLPWQLAGGLLAFWITICRPPRRPTRPTWPSLGHPKAQGTIALSDGGRVSMPHRLPRHTECVASRPIKGETNVVSRATWAPWLRGRPSATNWRASTWCNLNPVCGDTLRPRGRHGLQRFQEHTLDGPAPMFVQKLHRGGQRGALDRGPPYDLYKSCSD